MNDKTKDTGAGAGGDQGGQQQTGTGTGSGAVAGGVSGNAGQAAPWKKAKGARVKVLDWSRDPHNPVECDGTIANVRDDGTIDVDVHPPKGIEPYRQEGLTECTVGEARPGQWKRP